MDVEKVEVEIVEMEKVEMVEGKTANIPNFQFQLRNGSGKSGNGSELTFDVERVAQHFGLVADAGARGGRQPQLVGGVARQVVHLVPRPPARYRVAHQVGVAAVGSWKKKEWKCC